jgi:hypothetical protein
MKEKNCRIISVDTERTFGNSTSLHDKYSFNNLKWNDTPGSLWVPEVRKGRRKWGGWREIVNGYRIGFDEEE